MTTTKAVRIHSFGGPEHLLLDDVALAEPRDGEVLLRAHAASVNPIDYKIRAGALPGVTQDQLPIVLGRDVAGTVESCGADAWERLKQGDALMALLGSDRGGYAEYVIVRPDEWAPIPAGLDFTAAAAVPLAGLTAWQGLFDHGGLREGQRVLIHGGAGGVGHFAVQFARAKGAHVLATAAGEDLDFVRGLGADAAIDYRTQRFEDHAQDMDLVLDLIGGETQERSWAVLKRGGILVSTLAQPDPKRAAAEGKRGTNFVHRPNAAQLAEIVALIAAGAVTPAIDAVFSLADVRAAHDRIEHGHVRGKIVLTLA